MSTHEDPCAVCGRLPSQDCDGIAHASIAEGRHMLDVLELHARIVQLETAIADALHASASGLPDVAGNALRAGIGAERLARCEELREMAAKTRRIELQRAIIIDEGRIEELLPLIRGHSACVCVTCCEVRQLQCRRDAARREVDGYFGKRTKGRR